MTRTLKGLFEIEIDFGGEYTDYAQVDILPRKGWIWNIHPDEIGENDNVDGYAYDWPDLCAGRWIVTGIEQDSIGQFSDGSTGIKVVLKRTV